MPELASVYARVRWAVASLASPATLQAKRHLLAINWLALKALWVRVGRMPRGLLLSMPVRPALSAIIPRRLPKVSNRYALLQTRVLDVWVLHRAPRRSKLAKPPASHVRHAVDAPYGLMSFALSRLFSLTQQQGPAPAGPAAACQRHSAKVPPKVRMPQPASAAKTL